ncbi:hypothetical protein [Amycolatopsis sp. NPDC051128]|uniref:hypothetical protein n=1 Tax=Amycolatopsis sp. NPDC051128 TaxID=3155412 RepID=UPI0034267607
MDFEGRGWSKEHVVVLIDLATGQEVPVYTGLTRDPHSDDGRLVDVFAVEGGPTLRLGQAAGQLRVNIASTEQDSKAARRAGR